VSDSFDYTDAELMIEDESGEQTPVGKLKSISLRLTRQHAAAVELSVQNAILDDYDGVDIHRPTVGSQIDRETLSMNHRVEPWHYPPPDSNNGVMTERFEWRWFDNERLKEAIRTGETGELIEMLGGNEND